MTSDLPTPQPSSELDELHNIALNFEQGIKTLSYKLSKGEIDGYQQAHRLGILFDNHRKAINSHISSILKKEKVVKNGYTCRVHPTESWHEIGCPHQNWTKEQLQEALDILHGISLSGFEKGEKSDRT
jgi:hypothetical protein